MTYTTQEIEQQIVNTKNDITNKLLALGYKIDARSKYSITISKDGFSQYIGLDFTKERSSIYSSKHNGKYRLYIDQPVYHKHTHKKQFRSQKDGTLKINDVCEYIEEYFNTRKEIKAREAKAKISSANYKQSHTKLAAKHDFHEYSSNFTYDANGLKFQVSQLSEEQADILLSLAKTIGVKIS